jgi:hypothetical protein
MKQSAVLTKSVKESAMHQFKASEYREGMRVVTRNGEFVRIISISEGGEQPVIGEHEGTREEWAESGSYFEEGYECEMDLFFADPIPPFEPTEEQIFAFAKEAGLKFCPETTPADFQTGALAHHMVCRYALIKIEEAKHER